MSIDDSTPITARAYQAISDAATPGGSPQRTAITSLLEAVYMLETRQIAIVKALKSTQASVEGVLKVAQSQQGTDVALQAALESLHADVQKLSEESTPPAAQD
ncbi:MAG: hypothetical protein L0G94_10185 [Brachybacterium sp.]|uniref:hypothetical protein n=1 Tax=Brachybacterium sp. TaxID=1891286 RepID=UPI0026477B69|nr:hypothetical protein [Brachybacterium sp.]MDN5687022.1 hypothetical protein [Brachybacterium sp.]